MLRLSKKADYALMAMTHLALQGHAVALSAREIAEQYDIPVELLAKVLQRLARQGLLASFGQTWRRKLASRRGYRRKLSCGGHWKLRTPLILPECVASQHRRQLQ